jgi:uncharacterized membrane protein YdbT with pleckstrin-like domain
MNQNEFDSSNPNPADNPLNVMSENEQVVANIKRHPIGLLGVYFMTTLLFGLLFLAVGFLPTIAPDMSSTDKTYAFIGALSIAALIGLFAWIAIIIYKGNRWVVTSDSITQIQQTGLFTKQHSQLSLENLEDVTFEQNTLLQNIFGYGTLKVETAGEHQKFQFPYCPKPREYAVKIIEEHERFMHENEWLHNTKRPAFPGSGMTPEQMPPTSTPQI